MARPRIVVAGSRWGRLTVERDAWLQDGRRRVVMARCDCGEVVFVRAEDISGARQRRACSAWCQGEAVRVHATAS